MTLAEVQDELRASPPQIVNLEDIQLSNGVANGHVEQVPASGEMCAFNGDIFGRFFFVLSILYMHFYFDTEALLCICKI